MNVLLSVGSSGSGGAFLDRDPDQILCRAAPAGATRRILAFLRRFVRIPQHVVVLAPADAALNAGGGEAGGRALANCQATQYPSLWPVRCTRHRKRDN